MKDFIITVDHINPKKRKAMICKILTHMKKLGYTTVDRYIRDTDNPENVGYITTQGIYDKGWGMCVEWYGLCGKGTCHDCSCGWDKVAVEDFLKFTTSDVEAKKEESKKISCKIDLSWLRAEAREVISEAIQKKLFEAGVTHIYDGASYVHNKHWPYIYVYSNRMAWGDDIEVFNGKKNGCTQTKEQLDKPPEVSVNNALKGNFWTYSSTPKKEEPKPEGYKVSLASYTGKAREAISKAIQEEAFKKGYGWGWMLREFIVQNIGSMFVYFDVASKAIMQDSTEDKAYFDAHEFAELSVEEILSGALPKVN